MNKIQDVFNLNSISLEEQVFRSIRRLYQESETKKWFDGWNEHKMRDLLDTVINSSRGTDLRDFLYE